VRITNNHIQRNALGQLQANLKSVSEAQQRVSSGLRLQRASDDPIDASRAMATRGNIRALQQYRRNIDLASSRLSTEETALDQLGDLLSRAKELAVSQAGDTASAATRLTTKAEVDQIIAQAVSLGNTKYGEEYVFAAQAGDGAPFAADQVAKAPYYAALDAAGNPIDPSGGRRTEIAAGRYMQATHDGRQVFLDTGALAALKDLSDALGDGTDPKGKIADAMTSLDSAYTGLQTLVGEVGARSNQLEVTAANLDAFDINLKTLKSGLEEVDLEQAVTELVSRQSTFQAAMLATSRVMGLTLADYLR
jgi:flagellar hook-associated protein 3 FlgL